MATVNGSQFVIRQYDSFGGNFIDSQYLGAAYDAAKPYVFQNTLTRIFSSTNRYFTGNKFVTKMTGGTQGGTVEIDDEIYRWYLQGAETKSARSLGQLDTTNTLPGLNNTTFRIWIDLNYFAKPDVLMPEDNEYPLEIVDGPTAYGGGYVYTVRIQGDSPEVYLDPTLLEGGKEFDKVWTSVQSEYNQYYGTQQYPNSFMLESQVSAFAEMQTVTDKAWRTQGKLGIEFTYTDPSSGKLKKVDRFLPYAEAMMYNSLYNGMEIQSIYGKKQTKPADDRYWIKTGPGLREQLKGSWLEYYNGALTVNRMKDYLMDIFISRVDEQDRKVVAMTGTLGSLMFHDMLASEASSFLTVDNHFTQKESIGSNHLSFGAQYTRYKGPEGIEITLMKNPIYDSLVYSKRTHPQYTNLPIDSMRYTFLDFGTSNGSNNIQMLKVKDTFSWGWQGGTWTPTGPVKGGQVGGPKQGYDMYINGTCGIMVRDVTRCGEMIFDYEY